MICAVICEETVEEMLAVAVGCDCDVIEIRLDYLKDTSDLSGLSKLGKPSIATCMPRWEGGLYVEGEDDRVEIIRRSMVFADYITIELATQPLLRDNLISEAKARKVKVIVASHDFTSTPPIDKMREIVVDEINCGADIAKIAFTPSSSSDVLSILHMVVEQKDIPVIAIAMGDKGKSSRILAPLFGSFLTYGFPDGKKMAAPGQLSVSDLKSILGVLK